MFNHSSDKSNLQYMSRKGWRSRDTTRNGIIPFTAPVDYMIVSQTALNGNCRTHEDCCQMMRMTQNANMDPNGHEGKNLF